VKVNHSLRLPARLAYAARACFAEATEIASRGASLLRRSDWDCQPRRRV